MPCTSRNQEGSVMGWSDHRQGRDLARGAVARAGTGSWLAPGYRGDARRRLVTRRRPATVLWLPGMLWPIAMLGLIAMLWPTAGCNRMPDAAGPPAAGQHLRVRLVSEFPELMPGTTHRIAVLMELDPDWHVYAPARNDTGLPLMLAPKAPPGFVFGPPLWPAPERLVSAGALLDHVYSDGVAIVLPVEVPADAPIGEQVTLRCGVEWLECGTSCILGEGELEITLPVGAAGAETPPDRPRRESAHAERIRRSLARVPVPLDEDVAGVRLSSDSMRWTIEAPGAEALAFYPAQEGASLADPLRECVASSDRLEIRRAEGEAHTARLAGVLEIQRPAGVSFWRID